jgi:O-6-methylguanine DNA methyltransferase
MSLINCPTPIGNFYMIIDKNIVVKSGFGQVTDQPEIKNHEYKTLVAKYFDGDKNALKTIKFTQSGSKFTEKVWKEIAKIPYGQTMNYGEIAKNIGNPKAVRAVGTACGKNNIPLIIPCHRVIKSDGTIGNYAYGPKIKQFLLNLENQRA